MHYISKAYQQSLSNIYTWFTSLIQKHHNNSKINYILNITL